MSHFNSPCAIGACVSVCVCARVFMCVCVSGRVGKCVCGYGVGTKEVSEDIYMYMCIYIYMLTFPVNNTHAHARFSSRLYMAGVTKEEKTAFLEKTCMTIVLFTSIARRSRKWRRRRRRRRESAHLNGDVLRESSVVSLRFETRGGTRRGGG